MRRILMAKKERKEKKGGKTVLKVLCIILAVIIALGLIGFVMNRISVKSNRDFVKNSIKQVEYDAQLVPELEDGVWTFTADREVKVLQLTDIHIGGGFMSIKKDNMALNAVEAMVTAEKPDLVVVTGDITYPVPFQSGTFDNKLSARTFAELMEKLGVYWCFAFGNHDTEAYSLYTREDIAEVYEDSTKYPHCLFQSGPEDVDGTGNYIINFKNTAGKITRTLFMLDSHSYTDNDWFGVLWKYDCFHKNQVEWYENKLSELTEKNGGETPKSLMFYHIPLLETKEAYDEWAQAGFKDTANVRYISGNAGEHKTVVYSSTHNEGMFDAILAGGSTDGLFFGHDHLNTFAIEYKGVKMVYDYSIDYLAYVGIAKYGLQRGCTVITISPDGSYDFAMENYYQDKYKPVSGKETVTMDQYNEDAGYIAK